MKYILKLKKYVLVGSKISQLEVRVSQQGEEGVLTEFQGDEGSDFRHFA